MTQAAADLEFDILLVPVSHPELAEIRIEEALFAIGRTEAPFKSYPPEAVADLSRRHARIFSEYGTVYIADLDSKNGTSVNGADIRQQIARLRDGDLIGFGRTLSYRVQLRERTRKPRPVKLTGLTLTPERAELGLDTIVITQFPFLVSKADETFARYKQAFPHQVTYISRRHAHIFLKNGAPFIEDLGSTNGTYVDGKRLDEHAAPLAEGSLLALGGHHFVYRVSLQREQSQIDPTVTMYRPSQPANASGADAAATAAAGAGAAAGVGQGQESEAGAAAEKTTFVAAPDSFLEIFCIDQAQRQDAKAEAAEPAPQADGGRDRRRPRSRFALFVSELRQAFMGGSRGSRRPYWWGAALLLALGAGGYAIYLQGAPEREVDAMLADANYAGAAAAADRYLEERPDSAQLKALGTEALLKDHVPKWMALLKTGDFERARAVLADMKRLGSHNAEVPPLADELDWIGGIESFMAARGGIDAPVRLYADEDRIRGLLKRWDEGAKDHQKLLARIASDVPEFKDLYAEALSHLRKLQSDDSVYLAAADRLKATIDSELERGRPEQLDAVFKDYAQKYPRLAGLDALSRDLEQYLRIDNEARARRLGPLTALLADARFATPPFQARVRALQGNGKLPSGEVVQQYRAASKAWHEGDAKQAFAGLQKLAAGPWGDAASGQLEREKGVAERYAELQKARGGAGYDDRLLAFYGSLDHDEDVYYLRAVDKDMAAVRGKALRQAQELLNRAQAEWRRYRDNGAIEGGQRLEAGISNRFRSQARLLSGARQDAQQGIRIYTQLKADYPAQWNKLREEIDSEAELQRRSLLELNRVLEPELLKAKLALLGGDERQ